MLQSQRVSSRTLVLTATSAAALIALTVVFRQRSNNDKDDTAAAAAAAATADKNAATTTITTAAAAAAATSTTEAAASTEEKESNNDSNNNGEYSLSRDGTLLLHHLVSATSTQDAARHLVTTLSRQEMLDKVAAADADAGNRNQVASALPSSSLLQAVAVTAVEQTAGRGTHGRDWIAVRGNCFVTICIPTQAWNATGLPLTLLPIKIGLVVAYQVAAQIQPPQSTTTTSPSTTSTTPTTTIKWPNDVLVAGDKIAGVLIESAADWFLIGIGVNVGHAPPVPTSGRNHGRTSTCIRKYHHRAAAAAAGGGGGGGKQEDNDDDDDDDYYVRLARQMGVAMATDLAQWLARCDTTTGWNAATEQNLMLQQYRSFVDWKLPLVLRDTDDKHPVVPVDIEPDGRLRVARQDTGQERLVVSDYFF